MRKSLAVVTFLVLLVLAFGWFVWPTRYEYVPVSSGQTWSLLRVDRVTGRVWWNVNGVWVDPQAR